MNERKCLREMEKWIKWYRRRKENIRRKKWLVREGGTWETMNRRRK